MQDLGWRTLLRKRGMGAFGVAYTVKKMRDGRIRDGVYTVMEKRKEGWAHSGWSTLLRKRGMGAEVR